MAVAAAKNLTINSGDVPTAYVQSEIPKGDIVYYITQPQGYVDPEHPKWLMRLNMALYGVPIAGQCWNKTLRKFLVDSLGFKSLYSDPNMYVKTTDQGEFCLFPTVVDDTFDVCNSPRLRAEIYEKLIERFDWKPTGTCNWFLGCAVNQTPDVISMNQKVYIENLIKEFEQYKPRSSNTPASTTLLTSPMPDDVVTDFPYASLVGSLIWIVRTRPDIAYAVSQCAQFLSVHNATHDQAALKILGYLKKFPDYEIVHKKIHSDELIVDAYTDASYSDAPGRKSSYGYVVRANETPIAWRSKKTDLVCNSSCESEYYSLFKSSTEMKFVDMLLEELYIPVKRPFPLMSDSLPAIQKAEIPRVTQNSKHFDIKLHYIRDAVERHDVILKHVRSEDNIADIFTKPLCEQKFSELRDKMFNMPTVSKPNVES